MVITLGYQNFTLRFPQHTILLAPVPGECPLLTGGAALTFSFGHRLLASGTRIGAPGHRLSIPLQHLAGPET